ncbi:MAG: preprotein translocase subunit SecA [Candidatus Marinimicrobia bacterium]|nr:preprotein translocase subunit SecA [Candidatus Neomarinimicrobiota bacterium]MBT4054382.1 preprotein translocase subunit SecA [Candidatus Neomarinimicrobiota bacterium]MBT4370595.1 preprotein translocase subunit SecA [Candidatus Neomarinimicrobiota bacterium]MBT4662219.1 preprotein translocase subunit SecA [Candidatus Neomarinimicrobiota bacterium]MBT4828805.1 preprotein translocase subunit SecA [Candidatus Neomarinimicrobiota bacterium]
MILAKFFGTKSDREMKKLLPTLDKINQLYETFSSKTDEDLVTRTQELKEFVINQRLEKAQSLHADMDQQEREAEILKAEQGALDFIMVEAFAIVKETCRRICGSSWRISGQETLWEMVPYDVQLLGAITLHSGKVSEMKTGEGKTLVSTMPIYLNALSGRGVHVITVNDYLAQRDAEWMGEVYKRLGLTVGFILNSMDNVQRREMYDRDITYGTNNEFGFDYLRDNMALQKEDKVQRGHAFAVVDEVDSVLIDEARTPLIISGAVDAPVDETFSTLKPGVQQLVKKQTALVSELVQEAKKLLKDEDEDAAGLKLLQAQRGMPKHRQVMKIFQETGMLKLAQDIESIYIRDKKMDEVDEDLYFAIEEKSHVMDLTDKGRNLLAPDNPETFIIPDLGEMLLEIDEMGDLSSIEKEQEKEKAHQLHAQRSGTIHNFNQLLRAFTMYEKDVEYVLQDGKVMIVDEFTGRVLSGRRYSDGLHQALEAKENVRIERETQTLATITIQNYFRLYDKLAGMTGTAETEAEELGSIYGLDVTVVPTHRDIIRDDREDLVYKTKREKYNAAIDEISECHHRGQPVLVGTISVEISELLARMLKRNNIPHNVLNAKQHQNEAEIVARAGQRGAVTIATNMAGRGTDIKLGEGIKELGGLHIIGTERHESRRIDLQLRGRSGRQGDPGSSRFYLSLEDDLMRLFSSDRVATIMDKMGIEEGEVISAKMVTRAISNAQKKVEVRNFGIRKHLLEYDDVMNQQRQVVYDIRNQALSGEDMYETTEQILDDFIMDEIEAQSFMGTPDMWDWDHLKQSFASHILVDASLEQIQTSTGNIDLTANDIADWIGEDARSIYKARESLLPEDALRGFERFVILRTIDDKWKDHLYAMDQLREGINLRAYGQKNPLLEYKSEGFKMFQEMMTDMNSVTVQRLFRTQLQGMDQTQGVQERSVRNVQTSHQDTTGMGFQGQPDGQKGNQPQQVRTPVQVGEKHGRNEKITVRGPDGKQIEIKYKKLQNYLNRGYTQVS